MPLPSAFESELFCWRNHWKRQAGSDESISVSSLLATHTDNIFPNIRELLKILAILPMGSTEAERSFSCVQRIHTCLRSTMDDSQIWLSSPCMQTQLLSAGLRQIYGTFSILDFFYFVAFLVFVVLQFPIRSSQIATFWGHFGVRACMISCINYLCWTSYLSSVQVVSFNK